MIRRAARSWLGALGLGALALALSAEPRQGRSAPPELTEAELEHLFELSPLPDPPPDPTNAVYADPRAARLGQALFFDERLSSSGVISCATCHDPSQGWSDGRQLSKGVKVLDRHAMTLWNVAYNRWFFWDGRADTLWAQALHPFEDPREHATSRVHVLHVVARDERLAAAYERLFGPLPDMRDATRFPPEARPVPDEPGHPHALAWEGIAPADRELVNRAFANLGKSIAAYERRIVSRRAPFDVWVEGMREGDLSKQRWMSASAQRGLKLFLGKARCHACHDGAEFTDREFHDNRVPPLVGRDPVDAGRYAGIPLVLANPFNGIGAYSDDRGGVAHDKLAYLDRENTHNWGEFKTPTLRNVAVTAPYMHQGQLATLEDVVRYYSTLEDALPIHAGERLLQPLNLSDEEIADLVAFLQALTDESLPAELEGPPTGPLVAD